MDNLPQNWQLIAAVVAALIVAWGRRKWIAEKLLGVGSQVEDFVGPSRESVEETTEALGMLGDYNALQRLESRAAKLGNPKMQAGCKLIRHNWLIEGGDDATE